MFITPEYLGHIATLVAAYGYALYIISTLLPEKDKILPRGKFWIFLSSLASRLRVQGGSEPSRMTWFILATIAWMLVYGNYANGADATMGALIVNAVGSTIVAILSIRYGLGGWETIDQIALVGIVLTVLVWHTTGNNFIGLLCSLGVDLIALSPTIWKLKTQPWLEEALPWKITVASCFINVLALDVFRIRDWELATAISPVYLFSINAIVLVLIVKPRHMPRQAHAQRQRTAH